MNQPLVSICVITFNQKEFIRETLDSALAQDYDNIQIVVADDGSTDGTADIILDYSKAHPGKVVSIVGGPNLGVTGNSNRGLSMCTGKYIAILGGDDLMLPEKISTQVDFMEKNGSCDVSYHDVEIFESSTGNTISLFSVISKPVNGGLREAIRYGTVNCASASMYRRGKIPLHGFDSNLAVVSDWLFTIQTLEGGGSFRYINVVLGRYRRHTANVSNINSPFRLRGFADMLQTCAICQGRYPQHLSDVFVRLSAIFREARLLGGGRVYSPYLRASLRLKISIKALVGLFVYYVSGKKIML